LYEKTSAAHSALPTAAGATSEVHPGRPRAARAGRRRAQPHLRGEPRQQRGDPRQRESAEDHGGDDEHGVAQQSGPARRPPAQVRQGGRAIQTMQVSGAPHTYIHTTYSLPLLKTATIECMKVRA
jgi:hypothetical protein